MNVYKLLTAEQKMQIDELKGRLLSAVLRVGDDYYRVDGTLQKLRVKHRMSIIDVQDYFVDVDRILEPLFNIETPEGVLILHYYAR